ncbi:MAG TPA: hypothetical protein VGW40_06385 [Allosphingosinicella sp.]|nr:hypothetical protein [Allosphingosinicella sp.]
MDKPAYSFIYATRTRDWLAAQPVVEPYPAAAFIDFYLYYGEALRGEPAAVRAADLDAIFGFLEFLIWIERGLVTDICGMIEGGTPYSFSPDLEVGAGSVAAQEVGHSRRAYRLLRSLEQAESRPARWETPALGLMLDRLAAAHPAHAELAKLLVVIFAEIDFGTVPRLMAEERLAEPVREFAQYHETDEILHRVYFRKVLEELVPQLSPEEGRFAAFAIRSILRALVLGTSALGEDTEDGWRPVEAHCRQHIAYVFGTGLLADPLRLAIFQRRRELRA